MRNTGGGEAFVLVAGAAGKGKEGNRIVRGTGKFVPLHGGKRSHEGLAGIVCTGGIEGRSGKVSVLMIAATFRAPAYRASVSGASRFCVWTRRPWIDCRFPSLSDHTTIARASNKAKTAMK